MPKDAVWAVVWKSLKLPESLIGIYKTRKLAEFYLLNGPGGEDKKVVKVKITLIK